MLVSFGALTSSERGRTHLLTRLCRISTVLCLAQCVLDTVHGSNRAQRTLRFREVPTSPFTDVVESVALEQAVTDSQRAFCSVPKRIYPGELPHDGEKEARLQ